jgi:virginiamycin A acetyltransferase
VIKVAPSAVVSQLADIEDSVRGSKIIVGDRSVIDSFVKIKPAGGAGDLVIPVVCCIRGMGSL